MIWGQYVGVGVRQYGKAVLFGSHPPRPEGHSRFRLMRSNSGAPVGFSFFIGRRLRWLSLAPWIIR